MLIDPSTLQQHPLVKGFFVVVKERFRLTNRETQVLELLSLRGASNRELGDALHVSEKTMKNHVASIQRKLNVKSSRELQAVVFRDTLLTVYLNVFQAPTKRMEDQKKYVTLSH